MLQQTFELKIWQRNRNRRKTELQLPLLGNSYILIILRFDLCFKSFYLQKRLVVVVLYTEKELTRKCEKRDSKGFCFVFGIYLSRPIIINYIRLLLNIYTTSFHVKNEHYMKFVQMSCVREHIKIQGNMNLLIRCTMKTHE